MKNPLSETLRQLASAFESAGIPYLIGGSMASSVHGVPRHTLDVDIVARINPLQTGRLAEALGAGWYADVDQMRSAIAERRSFNLIDMRSGYKVDIFPATELFHQAQLSRAAPSVLPFLEDPAQYPVASAEDILLAKLQWYRAGGEVSDRQWNDITGLLAVNHELNVEYLDEWAARLQVKDLLARACADAAKG